jgi:uncharacterized membrane protein
MSEHPQSTAKVGGHPLHPMIVPFPIVFLVSALVTDIVYLNTSTSGWATASMWLLGAGISTALLAAALGLTDLLGDRRVRSLRQGWMHGIGNVALVALAAVSFYLRATGGAEEAIAPVGVTLSFVTVLGLLVTGWLGGELVYRHGVGVDDESLVHARVDRRVG